MQFHSFPRSYYPQLPKWALPAGVQWAEQQHGSCSLCLAKCPPFTNNRTVLSLRLRERPTKVKPALFPLCAQRGLDQPKLKSLSTGINNYCWNATWKMLMNSSLSSLFIGLCQHSFISLTKTRIRAISITARKVEAIKFYLNLARFNFSFLSKYFEPRVDFSSIISLFTISIF